MLADDWGGSAWDVTHLDDGLGSLPSQTSVSLSSSSIHCRAGGQYPGMEIVDDRGPLLCDWEVLQHLCEQRDARSTRRTSQSVLTIEFECIEYLKAAPSGPLSKEQVNGLLQFLAAKELTKLERLMIVNQLPKTAVHFHVIVEECEERFADDEIEQILEVIRETVGHEKTE
jgi:DNA-directed RNA polymerase subunit F